MPIEPIFRNLYAAQAFAVVRLWRLPEISQKSDYY